MSYRYVTVPIYNVSSRTVTAMTSSTDLTETTNPTYFCLILPSTIWNLVFQFLQSKLDISNMSISKI